MTLGWPSDPLAAWQKRFVRMTQPRMPRTVPTMAVWRPALPKVLTVPTVNVRQPALLRTPNVLPSWQHALPKVLTAVPTMNVWQPDLPMFRTAERWLRERAEARDAADALGALPPAERRRRALLTVRCARCQHPTIVIYRWGSRRLVWYGFDHPKSELHRVRLGERRPIVGAARRAAPEWWHQIAGSGTVTVKCRCTRTDRRVSVAALSDTLNTRRSNTTIDAVLYDR